MSDLLNKGCTPCVYIESTGTQYIDTGITPTSNVITIEMQAQYTGEATNSVKTYYGFMKSSSSTTPRFGLHNYNQKFMYGTNGTYTTSVATDNDIHTTKFVGTSSTQVLYIDNTQIASKTASSITSNTLSIFLMARNVAGVASNFLEGRLYYCKIYVDGVLCRNYIPCRNSSNVYGLYDTVNNVFNASASSSSFTGKVMVTAVDFNQSFRRKLLLSTNTGISAAESYNTDDYVTICAYDDSLSASFSGDGLEYRLGDGVWIPLAAGESTPTVGESGIISFRGNCVPTDSGIGTFTINGRCTLWGNCMSLLFGDEGKNSYSLTGYDYAFNNLFEGCSQIMSVSSEFLPATTLADCCYQSMFYGCTSLTTAPELPATTLAIYCYDGMFYNCKSLKTAPALPATTLAYGCYSAMFYNCTSLATAPALPATTLNWYCYENMFCNCTSLTVAPSLPATRVYQSCYSSMFKGCTSLTAAPKLPATTLDDSCYSSMFYGCTSLTTAPELPATTLTYGCYNNMFHNCKSLTTAPTLPATTLTTSCYSDMFYGCTNLTTAPDLPATKLDYICYKYMFYNCKSLKTAPALPATTLAYGCYLGMFRGCTNLTTAPELPATTLADSCYSDMFYGCTNLTTAPDLPATTLVSYCYSYMFRGCTRLNYIKMLATDISAGYCLSIWVYNVYSSGTFVKASSMTSLPTGDSGIPEGWTVQEV